MDQGATWYEGSLAPDHIVLDGDRAPKFTTHVYCGQTAGWIKMPLGAVVGLGPADIVLVGNPAPPHEKGTVRLCGFRHISTSGFCVGASRASFISVSGRPFQVTVRPRLRNNSPVYPVCSLCNVVVLWPNGWMDQDAT